MDFNKIITYITLIFLSVGCQNANPTLDGEYLIGEKLASVSSFNVNSNSVANMASLFDPTIRKIHRFSLNGFKIINTFDVKHATQDHYVLDSEDGNYTVDLTKKHLSIYNHKGSATHNPIKFFGEPKSAAFRPDLGYLVTYDNLNTVGMLKLDTQGNVMDSWVSGPVLGEDETLSAGDIADDGSLILSTSKNKLIIVDIEQSIAQKTWVKSEFGTTLNDISWIGTLRNQPNRIIVKSKGLISLADLSTSNFIDQVDIYNVGQLVKLSKSNNPHLLIKKDNGSTSVYYAMGDKIASRTIHNGENIKYLTTKLDLQNDEWSVVTVNTQNVGYYNQVNEVSASRVFTTYRVSDMLALGSKKLPDQAQLKITSDYAFALYPSELGFAEKHSLHTDKVDSLKLFNLKHIK